MEIISQEVKRLKIKKIAQVTNQDVYDLTTTSNHNFFANGVLVHNCGEQTLAPGGVCCLGTINITQFINDAMNGLNIARLKKYVGYMVRFLDNVSTASDAPLPEYKDSMLNKRRIGCGVMGWGSALFMMKKRFGSPEASAIREEMMQAYAIAAYEASIDLAEEKGMFLHCVPAKHAEALFVKNLGLSPEYMAKLRKTGIRNSSVLSQQPNGNSSIVANVVSGGIEPIFMPEYVRTVIVQSVPAHLEAVTPRFHEGVFEETSFFKAYKEGDEDMWRGVDTDGTVYKLDRGRGLTKEVLCEDYGVRFLKAKGEWDPKADYAVSTTELSVDDHVEDLKGFARWTDSACSKCVAADETMVILDGKIYYVDELPSADTEDTFTAYESTTLNHLNEEVKVKSVYENGIRQVIRVYFDDLSTLTCTPTHRIFTTDGFVKAIDLKIGVNI